MKIAIDGKTAEIPSGKDATINGQNTLEIVAGENVTIVQKDSTLIINATGGGAAPVLQSIEITMPPEKTLYDIGDVFDPAGMVVTAIYEGGLSKVVTDYTTTPDGPLEDSTDKVIISYTENSVTVTVEQPIIVTTTHIYGVTWDGTSTTKWTRTDESALFTDPVPYVAGATEYNSPFDNLMPWSGMIKEERTGGTMVAIPKFWYKLEQNTPDTPSSGLSIKISNAPVEGFAPSPAHMDRGDGKGERDVIYVGRYHCASDYKSKTGENPKVNISRATAREEIHKFGENIWQSDFSIRFTIWLLYLVEFADWNSQKVIGLGCGNGRGIESMGYTDTMPYHTGTTMSSRDVYGLGTQYRNIEGLWDNVYDFLDGFYDSSGLHIILNPANFSDSSGGTLIGNPPNGYPSKLGVIVADGATLFIPTEVKGSEDTYSCDEWTHANLYPIVAGACYLNRKRDGLFLIVYIGEAGGRAGYTGTRLQELP